MQKELQKELSIFACKIRMGVIEGTYNAKAGHPGGSLSIAEILTVLYNGEMKIDPQNPQMPNRDRLVLSKGHAAPGLYSALALKGYFPIEEIKNLRKIGKILQGHPDMKKVPGVDMSTGSLGQGISAAVGMALSAKTFGNDYRIYTILGDGELGEGQVWEAAMFAAHNKLDNLCAVIDYNNLQIDGRVDEVMNSAPIDEKFEAFGWHVLTVDAHDLEDIQAAFVTAREIKDKPTVIIAKSTKGKGVSFMEDQASWHGTAPNAEQYAKAIDELNTALAALEVE